MTDAKAKRPSQMTLAELDQLPEFEPCGHHVGATWFEENEPHGYTDGSGQSWRFAQYTDGTWYRYRR